MGWKDVVEITKLIAESRVGQHLRQPAPPELVAGYVSIAVVSGLIGGTLLTRQCEVEPAWAEVGQARERADVQARRADSLQWLATASERDAGAQAGLTQSWRAATASAQAQTAACTAALRGWGWGEIRQLEQRRASVLATSDALLTPGYYGNPAGGVTLANQWRAIGYRAFGAEIAAQITTLSGRLPM